ncbi:MAG TPA: hypothetical protein VM261_06475 [Kofleriaceae bacterium]|nr:hypothetical protein [Kofleriaceae bacterium]
MPDADAETRAQLARAAADPTIQAQLASHDDYLGALKLAGELWMMACLVVGIYAFFLLDERPPEDSSTTIAGLIVLLPVGLLAAAPGMWLSVTINRMLRAPERSVVARVTRCDGKTWVRRLEIVTADGHAEWVVPRFKAFIEGTSGAMVPGTIAVAVLRGDKLVDWFAYAGSPRA